MPRVNVTGIGRVGVVLDDPPYLLPPEAWSRVVNISFYNRGAARSLGEMDVFGTPPVIPYYLAPAPNEISSFWVYTNLLKVYCVIGSVHTNITRALGDYTGSINDRWNGDWINGVLILNNGIDDPQQWLPISTGTPLIKLANWPAATKAKVIRGFQNFLFALNTTEGGTNFPTKARWSHPADPGTVPVTWNEADATKLAGSIPLSDTPGSIVDGLALGPSFMVYKEDAIHRLDRIQTNAVFTQRPISLVTGIMAQRCMTEFAPGKHLFLSLEGDVLVTDGLQMDSVIDGINRLSLEQRIDGGGRGKCFVVTNSKAKEVYIAYPRVGSSYCDEMAVWNWKDSTWSFRDLTPTLDVRAGIFDETAVIDIIDNDTRIIDTVQETPDARKYISSEYKLLGAFPTVSRLRQVARGQKLGSVVYSSTLERQGLSLIGYARDGSPINDPNIVKLVTEIYPLLTAPTSCNINVFVGSQDFPQSAVTWAGPYPFDPTMQEKVDCYMEGRYIAVRFESDSEILWKMEGYGLKVESVGEYM